jgi:hypothetical protein
MAFMAEAYSSQQTANSRKGNGEPGTGNSIQHSAFSIQQESGVDASEARMQKSRLPIESQESYPAVYRLA